MKTILSILLITSSFTAQANDWDEAKKLVAAGQPKVEKGSNDCPINRWEENSPDKVGLGDNAMCMKLVELPGQVLKDVLHMSENIWTNDSDYDQRITKLYHFEKKYLSSEFIRRSQLSDLTKALNIPTDGALPSIESFQVTDKSFDGLAGDLSVYEYVSDDTQVQTYLTQSLKGQKVTMVSFYKEVDLYPGGGIQVTYALIFAEGRVLYVKKAGWNS